MHSHLLTNEELSLLLSPKQTNGPEETPAAEGLPDKTKELENRVERLEAALAQAMKRIVYLEDQLSVRQSAAALAVPEPQEAWKEAAESGPAEAPDAAGQGVIVAPGTLSRMETYKRKKKSLFGK
ncbi:hypothetical protein FE783_09310 [Paenibacillus mesophilus]|uniref:hypothetical protein n=1 Tax=Paenibacillus mesophilus TaxID=2582849 RepID=UPI00110E4551|nr:hypothetical protein [Paenibacillus mesophilus]TMV50855.1 hypothetical protein FE783_09310 [Paenibacillus mesophilus]